MNKLVGKVNIANPIEYIKHNDISIWDFTLPLLYLKCNYPRWPSVRPASSQRRHMSRRSKNTLSKRAKQQVACCRRTCCAFAATHTALLRIVRLHKFVMRFLRLRFGLKTQARLTSQMVSPYLDHYWSLQSISTNRWLFDRLNCLHPALTWRNSFQLYPCDPLTLAG